MSPESRPRSAKNVRAPVIMVTNSLEHVEIVGSREVAKLMQEKLKLYLHVIAATGSFGKPGITNQGFYFHVIQFANDFPTNDSND